MKVIVFLFFMLLIIKLHGQDTTFYDTNWKELKSKTNFEYYTVVEKNKQDANKVSERTYIKTHQIIKEDQFSDYSKKIYDGKCRLWNSDGRLKQDIEYTNGKYNGKFLTYWNNGQLKRDDTYEMGKLKEGHLKNSDGTDVSYYDYQIMPVYPGGTNELVRFISKETKYPKKAKRKGISGRVVVKFIVSKNGEIVDAVVVQGIDKELDSEALRVVNSMPRWEPGMLDGEKVNVFYHLPINFTLRNK